MKDLISEQFSVVVQSHPGAIDQISLVEAEFNSLEKRQRDQDEKSEHAGQYEEVCPAILVDSMP